MKQRGFCDVVAKTPSDLVKEMEEKKMVLNRKVCLSLCVLTAAEFDAVL